jgi:LysR family hydrogen peroxide-inducible transcriptional activator
MTLTELRYIVALAQTGHFGKAADKCYVSQPTLSIAIKKLEDELEVALFERNRQLVQPTPLGARIIRQAEHVLEQANQIKELADAGRDPLGSTLALGAIFTVGPYLFPQLIPQLQKLAPKMPLFIEENYTAVLREKLRRAELDAIVIALPFTEPDVEILPLYEEPFVMLLPADHALAKNKSIDMKQLLDQTVLLLGEGHCFRDQVLNACPGLKNSLANVDPSLRSMVEGGSLETLKHMVASKLGITILPQSAAQTAYDSKVLVTRPFSSNPPTRTLALAWRKSYPRSEAIHVVRDAIAATSLSKKNQ